ncbi:MAG: hypothetical protein FRX49_04092 [Trebouxia sp. A1-2]|nr:MAG: hypothetical protein FRX49_04092 [Trebouxia sp. A1-2]
MNDDADAAQQQAVTVLNTCSAVQHKKKLCNTWVVVRFGCKGTCIAEGLNHGALLIGQRVWHLKAEVCWVVDIPRQGAVHRRAPEVTVDG